MSTLPREDVCVFSIPFQGGFPEDASSLTTETSNVSTSTIWEIDEEQYVPIVTSDPPQTDFCREDE